jgi:hypothetical protein
VALATIGSSLGFADQAPDALKALQAAIEKEAAAAKSSQGSDEDGAERHRDVSQTILAQIRSAAVNGDTRQLEEMLNQISGYLKSEQALTAAEKLRSAIAADRAAQDAALAQQIAEAITQAGKAVKAAKTPADLDETIRQLGKIQDQRNEERYYSRSRVSLEKVRNTRQAVIRWQDYLSNVVTGNYQEAIQNLKNLSSDSSAMDLVPRSEILALIAEYSKAKSNPGEPNESSSFGAGSQNAGTPEQQVRDILDKTKTLEEIPKAIGALQELQQQPGRNSSSISDPLGAAISELTTILQGYREYHAGLPSQFDVRLRPSNFGGGPAANQAYTNAFPLRAQLLRLLAVQAIKAGKSLEPGPEEPVDKYMERVLETAKQKFDISLMKRVLEFQDRLAGRLGSSASLQTLLGAQNQEAAKQFVPAVVSYQNALKTGGEELPAKGIGERLESIKREHPEEYEQGMKWFLTPIQNVQLVNSGIALPPPKTGNPGEAAPGPSPAGTGAGQKRP